jgi:hypothetical protein
MVLTCREMQQVKVYWRCWSDLGEFVIGDPHELGPRVLSREVDVSA